MTTVLLAFVFFAVAVAAMSIGVVVHGRNLKGSCGGVAAALGDDSLLDDCVCARKEAEICASDEENELIKLAEIGHPNRKDYFRGEREAGRRSGPGPLEV